MPDQGERIIVHLDSDLEPIVPRFMELRQEDLAAIDAGLQAGDYETLARIGHSIKGAGGGYGFDYITELGRSIEQAAKARDAGEIRRIAEELSRYLQLVDVVFDG